MSIFGLTREQRRDRDWAAYQAAYQAAYDEALAEHLCFCTCGCKAPDTIGRHPLTSAPVPGRCEACRRGPKDEHSVIRPPVETFDWAKYEDPAPPPRRRRRYVRMSAEAREKTADEKADFEAALRSARGEWRSRRKVNLNGVHITDDVADGSYAVRDDADGFTRIDVKRQTSGPLKGFIMVTLTFGESVPQQHGIQQPQPSRAGYVQTYQGPFAHLVKRLVDNPQQARADFEEATHA